MSDAQRQSAIAVLGASGLIGAAVAEDLRRRGFHVAAIARKFTSAQRELFAGDAIERQMVSLDSGDLAKLLSTLDADIVVNCIGVLQDGQKGGVDDVHSAFAARLSDAIVSSGRAILLAQLSIPGAEQEDRTPFSRTKREAERLIAQSGVPHVILRPGFVIAPAACGGSALVRALAALPFRLPAAESDRPLAATAVSDIGATLAHVATRWRGGKRDWRRVWDVMERHPSTVGEVIEAFRRHFGGPSPVAAAPRWLLGAGASLADLAARLGWSPPIRSTALAELRRGVAGDPGSWIAETGIEPASLASALAAAPATIQERWFARLYMAKALIFALLSLFWVASGAIAMTVSFEAAAGVMAAHGFSRLFASNFIYSTAIADILVGLLIAIRRTSRVGLTAGIILSLLYLAGATAAAPGLWIDPLGPLVKIFPAIGLMLAALAILDDR